MQTNNTTGETQFYHIYSQNLGWTCPICGKVFSPTTIECPYCNANTRITSDNSTICTNNINNK